MVLDLDEIVFLAEDFHEAAAGAAGVLPAVVEEVLGHERGKAAGEADQSLGVQSQGLQVGARLVVHALQVGIRYQLEEVLVSGGVTREQAEVEDALALVGASRALQARASREVEFAADERLEALGLGLVVELDRAVQIPMVGEGEGLHPQPGGAVHQAVDTASAVQQAVVAVDMEMDEIGVGGRHGSVMGQPPDGPGKRESAPGMVSF